MKVIDGDDVRENLHRHLGFSFEDIKENNRLITQLCRSERLKHDIVIVPIISPFEESRAKAREELSPGFHLVFFDAALETVTARDTKGLYAKAARGEIDNMIGMAPEVPYEAPIAPELALGTAVESPESSALTLYSYIMDQMRPGQGRP